MIKLKSIFLLLVLTALLSCTRSKDEIEGFRLIGTIKTVPTTLINNNSWTIGCEVLDRDYADYSSYRDYLSGLGAKTARLQLGWAKCEKQKGVYDFTWLKDIAEDLKSKKIRPWFQFSYGNPIYEGGGEPTLAGGLPHSEEALAAWDKWVKETIRQFEGYTNYWEVWNEPNLPDKNKVIKTPEEYSKFFIRTAEIIRKEQPDAFISGLVLCGMHRSSFTYITGFLEYLNKVGKLDLLDEMTYHPYPKAPEETYPLADSLRTVISNYSSKITIKHGETGCPAEFNKSGVLPNLPWTEISQSKWLLRRMCADFANNIPTSIFTIIDYTYPYTKSQGHSYTLKMGLLAKDSVNQSVKMRNSYRAVQNTISVLNENWGNPVRADFKTEQTDSINRGDIYCYQLSNNKSGNIMLMVWLGNKMPGDSHEKSRMKLSVNNLVFRKPVLIDLLNGEVFSISNKNIERKEESGFTVSLPVYDSPVIVTEESEVQIFGNRAR